MTLYHTTRSDKETGLQFSRLFPCLWEDIKKHLTRKMKKKIEIS